jgi:diaminopimelate epimerase
VRPFTRPLAITKAHAYGNDFLLTPDAGAAGELSALARALCNRHEGIGADGLILYELRGRGAAMRLLNADGSWSELSGNGLRCLAALVARAHQLAPGMTVHVETQAGPRTLDFLAQDGERYEFRAAMGAPAGLREVEIAVLGETIVASVMTIGNPQCIVLGRLPDAARFEALGPALATHPMFAAGTNVEFVQIDAPDRVRILIWERGVGPTSSSGTGSSASAVAAAAFGGAARSIDVVAPGGIQHVEWRQDGVYLTGWAEIVLDGHWLGAADVR